MAYEIPIDSTPIDDLIAKLEKAGIATRHLREETGGLNQEMRGMPRGGGPGGIHGGGGGMRGPGDPWSAYDAARRNYPQPTPEADRAAKYHEALALRRMQNAERLMSPTTPALKYAPGPHQRAFEAEQLLQNALTSGDPRKIRDAEIYSAKARAARDKADAPPKTKDDLMFEAFISSRIGPGGMLLPLISKLKAAGTTTEQLQKHFIGMGADPDMAGKLAPVAAGLVKYAMPIALASAAVAVVGAAAAKASQVNKTSSDAFWGGGGTPRETARGIAMAGFVGKDLSSAANGFGEQLRQGTYGAGYFRSKGIVDQGPYTIDKTSNYLKAIDEIRRIKSDQEAIRIARDTGMSPELRFRDLGDDTYQRVRRSMDNMAGPNVRKQGAEWEANKAIIGNWFDQQVAATGNRVVQVANWAAKPFGGLDKVGGFFHDLYYNATGSATWDWLTGADQNQGKKDSDKPSDMAPGGKRYRELKDGTEQIGGAGRANGIPSGWSSSWKLQNTDEALKAQTVMMGGFAVG